MFCEGKFVYANRATAKTLGVESLEDLIGKSLMDFVHPDYRNIVKERVQQVLKYGKSIPPSEYMILRADGTVAYVETGIIPYTYGGKPAIQGVCRDVTGRKRLG